MVQLRLRVAYRHGERGAPMAVTSDMLEVIPSANDVSSDPSGLVCWQSRRLKSILNKC